MVARRYPLWRSLTYSDLFCGCGGRAAKRALHRRANAKQPFGPTLFNLAPCQARWKMDIVNNYWIVLREFRAPTVGHYLHKWQGANARLLLSAEVRNWFSKSFAKVSLLLVNVFEAYYIYCVNEAISAHTIEYYCSLTAFVWYLNPFIKLLMLQAYWASFSETSFCWIFYTGCFSFQTKPSMTQKMACFSFSTKIH